ncbi:hypothetical protein LCGC14_2916140, partial [marine sediment metagenome]
IKKRCIYLKPAFWKKFDKMGFGYNKAFDDVYNMQESPLKVIKRKNFDTKKLVWFDGIADSFYALDEKNPMSIPYRISYIGGITNEYFDLNKVEKILKANPYVWDIKNIAIPYYNCSRNCNVAVEFMVRLPQDTHDKICEYFKNTVKAIHWTCAVKNQFVYRPYFEGMKDAPFDVDVLGIREAFRDANENEDDY